MDWQQRTQHSTQSWDEAQQHMLSGWSTISYPVGDTHSVHMGSGPYNGATATWHTTMLQSIRHLTSQSDSTARDVAERLFVSQMGTLRLLELAINAWGIVLPRIRAGEAWQTDFQEHIQQLRALMLRSATNGLHVSGSVDQLWQAFLREGQLLLLPWLSAHQNVRAELSEDPSGLLNLSSLSGNIYRKAAGSALQGMGQGNEIDEKLRHSFAAWQKMQQAAFDYNSQLTDVWINAFERLIRELAVLAEEEEMVENVRDFLNRWSAIADEIFKERSRTEGYIQAQAQLINTIMVYRGRQRQVNETVMAWIDLPSRSEMDEAHRRVYELNKEVKALKRELREIRALLEQSTQQPDNKADKES